jgi:hypothetical protein
MATTTPNYGWDVPTSTDYVKDGATAIETLGDDIDATLYTVTNGRNVGLVPLNTTTTAGASTVTIQPVFSATYDNYYVEWTATAPSTAAWSYIQLTDGATPVTTPYRWIRRFDYSTSAGTVEISGATAGTFMPIGFQNTSGIISGNFTLTAPFLAARTLHIGFSALDQGDNVMSGWQTSMLGDDTSHNGIKFTFPNNVTSTIRIYGIRNS